MANERCCPELPDGKKCDYIDLVYRLTHVPRVDNMRVAVEVAIHVRVERCTLGYQLGNLIYSTTLLPGERVRLFTADRRSRFTFDTESQLSYRQEHEAEEQTYMESMSRFMSDLESSDRTSASASSSGSSSSSGGASGIFETIFSGPSVSMNGSYNAQSTASFLRELGVHAQSSHNSSVQATRHTSAVSVGEVQSRTHAEGTSEDHLESASRTFSNENRCHAVSYLFYQVHKEMSVRLQVRAIRTRVKDPAGSSAVVNQPVSVDSKLHVIPAGVLATSVSAEKVTANREAFAVAARAMVGRPSVTAAALSGAFVTETQPLDPKVADAAEAAVRDALVKEKLVDAKGEPTAQIRQQIEFEFKTTIPTPGIVVKGCLDDCNTCEPARQKEIELQLKRQELENQLLSRQIELLEKSQEYRCCPPGEPAAEA